MKEDSSEIQRIKCPFCAELILPDAKICRFCRSDLQKTTTEQDKPAKPISLGRAMILNLICPGLGAWRLGYRFRGVIIFLLVIGLLVVYINEVIPVINKAVNMAIRSGNVHKLNTLTKKLKQNCWFELATYVYIYSFIELYFLLEKTKKTQPPATDAKEK